MKAYQVKVNDKMLTMTRDQMVDFIIDYYNDHFKWQKFVYDEYIDRELVEKLTDDELKKFIEANCQ